MNPMVEPGFFRYMGAAKEDHKKKVEEPDLHQVLGKAHEKENQTSIKRILGMAPARPPSTKEEHPRFKKGVRLIATISKHG